jgi:hypothetical protein
MEILGQFSAEIDRRLSKRLFEVTSQG